MKRQILTVVFLWLACCVEILAQDGKLSGKVLDKDGQPLPFVSVVVFEGDLFRYGAQTNEEGFYSIQPVTPGTYRVEARFLGKVQSKENVPVLAGQTRQVDLQFSADVTTQADTVEIVEFVNPVFEKDPTVVTTLSGEDVKNIGTRNVQSIAAITPGVYQSDEGDFSLSIRGARSTATTYYIDGVKIRGVTSVPQAAISQFQVYTGGTPAELGDFTGGVISITTANPAAKFSGGGEVVTSEYLDPFGRTLAALTLTGPLITRNKTFPGTEQTFKTSVLGYFLSGEFDFNRDQDPAARGIFQLREGVLQDLRENPVEINDDGITFRSRANFIRATDIESVDAKLNNQDRRIRLLSRLDFQPSDNILVKLGANYEHINSDLWSISNMLFAPDASQEFEGNSYRGWLRFQQSFRGGEDALITNLFYSLQADYSRYDRVFQHRVHQDNFFDYGYIGKFEFDLTPIYGYVDDPLSDISSSPYWITLAPPGQNNLRFDGSDTRNPILANYNQAIFDYVANNGVPNLFPGLFSSEPTVNTLTNLNELAFRQGLLNGQGPASVYSLFSGVGAAPGGYTKFNFEQFRLTGQATAEIKGHNFKAGFEFEQRVERQYALGASALWTLMRQYANFHLNTLNDDPSSYQYITAGGEFQDTVNIPVQYVAADQREFDRRLRQRLGLPVDGLEIINTDALGPDFYTLDLFNADELLNDGLGIVSYYGYDHLGNRTGSGDAAEFFSDEENRPMNPFSPTYISAFIQDKFEFEDIRFNIGLRVDRFDANQPVLKDPFSLHPTFTAGEVATGNLGIPGFELPAGVEADWVPYVDNAANPSEVIGYRNGEIWYDATGAPVSSNQLAVGGNVPQPFVRDNEVSIESFEDYTPQTTFMPRISFSFPITDEALFFAHYDVLAQRPGQLLPTQGSLLAGQLTDYLFLENRPTSEINNPNLKPEITIDYEAGFKQKIGSRMALSLSAFYREMRNMVRFRRFANAYPFSYDTYDNLDFGTVKGFVFSLDMRRTRNTQLRVGYTLQYADATGSDFTSARNIVNFLEGVGVLRVPLPINTDQRHRISAVVDYRFAGTNVGPSLNLGDKTVYPFRNFGANLTLQLGSGTPFSKNSVVVPAVQGGINIVNQIQGTPNGFRRPWQFRADLRVDKVFTLGGKEKPDGGTSRLFDFNVYLLVLNLFDTENVINVYRFTGLPDDDGYLLSNTGQQAILSQIDPVAFTDLYRLRVNNPSNYSLPRRIRLGVQFSF